MAMAADLGTYMPDNLIVGHKQPIVTDTLTIAAGQILKRGAVLGLVEAGGKAKLLDKSAADGSQKFYAILAENVDAETEDKAAPVYLSGEFNAGALSFAEGTTAADIKAAARMANTFLRDINN